VGPISSEQDWDAGRDWSYCRPHVADPRSM